MTATFELAATADGPAIMSAAGTVSPSNGTHIATGAIPLARVAPGDTLVRARILVDGMPAGAVVRTLRKAGQ